LPHHCSKLKFTTRVTESLFTRDLAIALLGGFLMGLTPAPVNAWILAWISLAPLWVLIYSQVQNQRSASRCFWLGLVWGIGYHGLALFWITGIHPMTWMGVPWFASLAIALTVWLVVTLWGAVLAGLWAWGMAFFFNPPRSPPHYLSQKRFRCSRFYILPWGRILGGSALWCGLESLWSTGPLFWSSLSYTQSPYNLAILHLGQLSGPFLITAVIVAVNGFLAEAWIAQNRSGELPAHQLLTVGFAILVGAHLIGFGLYSRPLLNNSDEAIEIGIIQGNIPNSIKLYEEGWQRAIAGYTDGYRQLADRGVDAILTPEIALPMRWERQDQTTNTFYQAILDKQVPVWLGAFGGEKSDITNSLFTIAANAKTVSEYRKVKLVPLGEYIPLKQWIGNVVNRLSPLKADMVPGTPSQLIDTPFGRVIIGICYESAFSQHFRFQATGGGQFILTASNNAHYSPAMPAQHYAQDVMRAIETDRWMARATNTGYSGVINPHGEIVWKSGINTYETHSATIYRRQHQTLYVVIGDWFTPLLVISSTVIWFYSRTFLYS